MLTATRQRATSRDYEALPEGIPCQLIDGELIVTPGPTFNHQGIIFEFAVALGNFLKRNKLGRAVTAPVDVIFDDDNAYQPDVVFVRTERLGIIKRGRVYGAPDLVVEVLSPGNASYDLNEKKATYERCGVREYWIVDPSDESIDLFVNEGGVFRLIFSGRKSGEAQSRILEGFRVSLSELFAE